MENNGGASGTATRTDASESATVEDNRDASGTAARTDAGGIATVEDNRDAFGTSSASGDGGSDCIPQTCGELGRECGSFDDGCGSHVNCGCAEGLQCHEGRCWPPGGLMWVKRIERGQPLSGMDIAADSERIVLGGGFVERLTFGPDEIEPVDLVSTDDWDMFLAVLHSDGSVDWAQRYGGSADDGIGGVALGDGGIYAGGSFEGSVVFDVGGPGETRLTASDSYRDPFLARFLADGSLDWIVTATGPSGDSIANVVLVGQDLSVTGLLRDSLVFGLDEEMQTTLQTDSLLSVFVARYTTDGRFLWAQQAGLNSYYNPGAVVGWPDGEALIATHTWGEMTFGAGQDNETQLEAFFGSDLFLARYSADGRFAWAVHGSCFPARGLAALADGSTVVAMDFGRNTPTNINDELILSTVGGPDTTFTSDDGRSVAVLARYDAFGGLTWFNENDSTASTWLDDVAALPDGTIVVTGHSEGQDPYGLPMAVHDGPSSDEENDVFVAKFDPEGQLLWSRGFGGTGDDRGEVITLLSDGTSIVVGRFQGTATFGLGQTTQTALTAPEEDGGEGLFVAKLAP